MKLFAHAHATHPDWRMSLSMAVTQLQAQMEQPLHQGNPTLGWVYLTDHYATHARELLDSLQQTFPGVSWVGTVGVGVAANGVEYIDEPALALMLSDLSPDSFRLFSGTRPLGQADGFDAYTALVHADPTTPDLGELVAELASRTQTGYLFGGLSASRSQMVQIAGDVLHGGLSGVAFGADVTLVSRVTQGCQPVSASHEITAAERHVITRLDGRPALDVLLADLGIDESQPRDAVHQLRSLLVGLTDAHSLGIDRPGQFGSDTRVRHLIGIDPQQRGIAIADVALEGMRLAFSTRGAQAARRDLVRICAEIREELEPQELPRETATLLADPAQEGHPHPARRIAGAIYVSCAGRGGPHFGAPSAELQIIRHALGDVPLVGYFAGGEIARHHIYGYTGVLTVFVAKDDDAH